MTDVAAKDFKVDKSQTERLNTDPVEPNEPLNKITEEKQGDSK